MAVVVVSGMNRETFIEADRWRVEDGNGNLILLDAQLKEVAEFNYWDSVHRGDV